jgi:uncharacterized membrane protein
MGRLIVPVTDWDAFVNLAFDEIRMAGAQSPQVTRRLTEALDDLETVAPPERLPALQRQRELLSANAARDADFFVAENEQVVTAACSAPYIFSLDCTRRKARARPSRAVRKRVIRRARAEPAPGFL